MKANISIVNKDEPNIVLTIAAVLTIFEFAVPSTINCYNFVSVSCIV